MSKSQAMIMIDIDVRLTDDITALKQPSQKIYGNVFIEFPNLFYMQIVIVNLYYLYIHSRCDK